MKYAGVSYLLPGLLLLTALVVRAQPAGGPQAQPLPGELGVNKPGADRAKVWLRLEEYQVYKPGESQVPGEAGDYLRPVRDSPDKGGEEAARAQAQKALDRYARNGSAYQAGDACLKLGNMCASLEAAPDGQIRYYRQALQWFVKAGDRKKQADVGKALGALYLARGDYARALTELQTALSLYHAINYPQVQGVYDLLGNVFTGMGDYQEALRYALLALQTAESVQDSTRQMCTIYNRVGLSYLSFKQYEKGLFYYRKALNIARKYDDRALVMMLTGNISDVLLMLSKPEQSLQLLQQTARHYPPRTLDDSIATNARFLKTYTYLKAYATAQQYCSQLLALYRRLGENDAQHQHTYCYAIPYFLATKQHGQSRKYLARFEAYCKKKGDLRGAAVTHKWWFKLDSMQGNYPSAIRHYQLHKQLHDSLLNETKSLQLAALEVQYETEKKEKDLRHKEQNIRVLIGERRLQDRQMERDVLVRNVSAGGAALLLLLLGVIYNRYRLKRRSNQLLEDRQQEIDQKNRHLSQLLGEKDSLLGEKDVLLAGQERLLAEKERLLKEIHHRVKNNLQVVMSLLNSQADALQDGAALSAIQESQHRVQAMALIHQKLYQAQGVARIPMHDYIEEVVAYLHDSYCLKQLAHFELEVEPIELDVTQAVPLGLIINEAITNAFKYAFPDGRSGTVTLRLQRHGEATYQLVIADDGVGLPANYDPSQSRSLGMTLLHGFSGQLGGELTITSPPGLTINLVFQEEQLSPSYAPVAYAQ
jgi:two-component sensor histidine kinase